MRLLKRETATAGLRVHSEERAETSNDGPTTPDKPVANRVARVASESKARGRTYRGLYLSEWWGVWRDRVESWLCALRGHEWGPWLSEVDDPWMAAPQTRCCHRCWAYEERLP